MSYRDDRTATRAQVDELERELAATKEALASAREAAGARGQPGKLWPVGIALAGSLALFAAALFAGFGVSEADHDFAKLGLVLDTLRVESVRLQ